MDFPSLSALFYVPVGMGLDHSLSFYQTSGYVKMSCADFLWFPQKALPSEDFPIAGLAFGSLVPAQQGSQHSEALATLLPPLHFQVQSLPLCPGFWLLPLGLQLARV